MKHLLASFLYLFPVIIVAQAIPAIQTDRPDQTECPFIVPKGFFQFENGFAYQQDNNNTNQIVIPTVLSKFGINDSFELRIVSTIATDANSQNFELVPVLIGFKSRLFNEKGIVPTTSFIGHLSLPKLATTPLQNKYLAPLFRFTMQHTINSKQTLSYNLGAEWNGETPEPTAVYTITTGRTISDKIGIYVELYGFVPQNGTADHRCDGGLTYLFNANHQVDFSCGFGLKNSEMNFYIGCGYSFRFKI